MYLHLIKIELKLIFFQVHQKTNAHKLAEYHNRMLKEIDYKNDDDAKPPYSYAALICLSMKDTKKKMTLSQIYKWIRDNFAYYRKADKSWQVRNGKEEYRSLKRKHLRLNPYMTLKALKRMQFFIFPNSQKRT